MVMTIRNVSQAKAELSALLVRVERGEEVLIARAGTPVARLTKIEKRTEPRKFGDMAGKVWISPDFDEPDLELEELIYGTGIEPAP
jgi:prevent-host-death family protein